MFKNCIRQTALTDEMASGVLGQIKELSNLDGDVTWLSTMRALLSTRLGEYDHLDMVYYKYGARDVEEVKNVARDNCGHPNWFEVLDLYGISDEDSQKIDGREIEKELNGYVLITRVTDLFRKNFTVFCFVNEEIKSTMVVCFNLTIARFHYMQCATIGMIPWYFNELTDRDKEILYSLRGDTSAQYCDLMRKIADELNIRNTYIKNNLAGFENRYNTIRLDQLKDSIADAYRNIQDYERSIADLLAVIEKSEFEFEGVQKKMNSDCENELVDYFIGHKCLELRKITDTKMTYVVRDYLTEWNIDMAETYINNMDSYFYYDYRHRPEAADWKKLLEAIFIDEELKIRFCSAYEMNTRDAMVRGLSGYRYGESCDYHMPNPHIDRYSCIGGFEPLFREAMRKHDYLMAVEESIVSARSLNFSDSTVMDRFIKTLLGIEGTNTNFTSQCIELPDGTMVDYKGAIKYLKGKENGNE